MALIREFLLATQVQVLNKKMRTSYETGRHSVRERDGFDSLDERLLETFCNQVSGVIKSKSIAAQYQSAKNQGNVAVKDLLSTYASTDSQAQKSRRRSLQTVALKAIDRISKNEQQHHSTWVPHQVPTMEPLNRWGFPCLDCSPAQLVAHTTSIFGELGLLQTFNIPVNMMNNFVTEVAARYNNVPYHNFYHAFSVFQSCAWFCAKTDKGAQMKSLEKLSMLVASLCHDCGHTGVNNQYTINHGSELATLYNDMSPLENMHAWSCFNVMKVADIFAGLTLVQKSQARSTIVKSILATDMVFHKQKLEKMSSLTNLDGDFLIEVVLHTMDIGSTAHEWPECVRWSRCVAAEFSAQVALEKESGMAVSTFMDIKNDLDLVRLQADFIGYIVLPAFSLLQNYVPTLNVAVQNLRRNRDMFMRVARSEIQLPQRSDVDLRLQSYSKNVTIDGVTLPFASTFSK